MMISMRDHVLPDFLTSGLDAVICGTAAGPTSAVRGHYYAGPGNRFWSLMYQSGITPELLSPAEDSRVIEFGIGLTDLAKLVASGSDTGLRSDYDMAGFVAKMEQYAPRWVVFHGKRPGQEVSKELGHGGEVRLGVQAGRRRGRDLRLT